MNSDNLRTYEVMEAPAEGSPSDNLAFSIWQTFMTRLSGGEMPSRSEWDRKMAQKRENPSLGMIFEDCAIHVARDVEARSTQAVDEKSSQPESTNLDQPA